MHAVRLHEFGPPERLRWEQVPDPEPGPGEVRVDVRAAGVHVVDTAIRAGDAAAAPALPELPTVLGRDVAGVVEAAGAGVDPGWVGRPVVAYLGAPGGGYAERAVVAAGSLHELPAGGALDAAVAMVGTGRTALAILETAALTGADTVLVTAAAGGLGALLVQAARRAGAHVVGVAGGAAKAALVRDLGAHGAVDYTAPDWPALVRDRLAGRELTAVLDGVGGDAGRAALDLLGTGGRIVLYGWTSGRPTPLTAEDLYGRSLTATAAVGARVLRRPGGLRGLETEALAALAKGELTPLLTRFAVAEAAAAHRALEQRETVGKVVLVR